MSLPRRGRWGTISYSPRLSRTDWDRAIPSLARRSRSMVNPGSPFPLRSSGWYFCASHQHTASQQSMTQFNTAQRSATVGRAGHKERKKDRTYHTGPLPVGATSGVRVSEHVGTILIVHDFAVEGSLTRGHGGSAVERPAPQKCIELCFARGRFPRRPITSKGCRHGRELGVEVEGFHSGIVWSPVVVGTTEGSSIEPVYGICNVLLRFRTTVGAV